MSKHTPGPWFAEFGETDGYDCMTGAWDIFSTKPNTASLATVDQAAYGQPHCDYKFRSEEAAANARLISAAPELLVWLRRLREIVINEFAADPGHVEAHRMVKGYQDDVDAAGAVIAKAEQ